MREWAMADIVQQDGYGNRFLLFGADIVALALQGFNSEAHQVHGTQSMVKACVQGTWINQVRHAQLFDVAQPLKIRMLHQVEYQFGWDADKTVNRIVDNFLFVQDEEYATKMLNLGK